MRDAILLSPMPPTDDAYARRQRTLADRAATAAADVAEHLALYPSGARPTDFGGGSTCRFDPNGGPRPGDDAALDSAVPLPDYSATVEQLVSGDPSPAALEGMRRAALAGAADARRGGLRRATGRSSEHVPVHWTEDDEAAADAVQSAFVDCMAAFAEGHRYGIPGRIIERDGATWQRVRRPAQHARQLAKRYGQRRSRDRIRMRDGLSPRATDYEVPDLDRGVDERTLIEAIPRARREAFVKLVQGRTPNRARDLRAIAERCTPDQCAALVAVAVRAPDGAPRLE